MRWKALIQMRRPQLRYLSILGVAVAIIGCGSFSPFLAAQFNANLPGVPVGGGGGGGNGNDNDNGDGGDFDFLEELPLGLRTIQSAVLNSSTQQVQWRLLYAVTAGEGGFVQEDESIQDYLRAGYRDVVTPGSPVGTTTVFGCVPLRLFRGTRLLVLEFGSNVRSNLPLQTDPTPDDPATGSPPEFHVRNDTGDLAVPVPESIIFATEDPTFLCDDATRPCTQEAFRYFDPQTSQEIGKAVSAARIQGTVCQRGLAQSPESRLDRTLNGTSEATQFPPGATIVWRVLDRAFDTAQNQRVQVVWTVLDADGELVHNENP